MFGGSVDSLKAGRFADIDNCEADDTSDAADVEILGIPSVVVLRPLELTPPSALKGFLCCISDVVELFVFASCESNDLF